MSTVNLIPEDYAKRRAQRRANVLCCVLFVVVMAAVGGAAIVSEAKTRRTKQIAARVSEEYARAASLIDQLQELELQKKKLIAKAENTSALMERVPRSYLIGFITNARPENVALLRVILDNGKATARRRPARGKKSLGPTVKSFSPSVDITIYGQAKTDVEVALYIARLRNNPLVDSVDLIYSVEARKRSEENSVRSFHLEMTIKPGMDAIEAIQASNDHSPSLTEVALVKAWGAEE